MQNLELPCLNFGFFCSNDLSDWKFVVNNLVKPFSMLIRQLGYFA